LRAIVNYPAYLHLFETEPRYDIDTETGPGVLETALAYTSALRMADNAILFKYAAKSTGMKHGIIPSFMAKPWNGVSVSYFSHGSDFSLTVAHCDSFLAAVGEPVCFSSRL
jgi:glutamine synthetase